MKVKRYSTSISSPLPDDCKGKKEKVKLAGGLGKRLLNFAAMGIVGLTIMTITAVLIVIAVWPPFNTLSLLLPVGFVGIMLSIVFFVKSTDADQQSEMRIDCKIE